MSSAEKLKSGKKVEDDQDRTLHIVRQERRDVGDVKLTLSLSGKSYPVVNFSALGVAIEAEGEIAKEEYQGCKLEAEGICLAEMTIKWARQEEIEPGCYKVGFRILGSPLNVDRIMLFPEVRSLINSVGETDALFKALPAEFVATVFNLKDCLLKLEAKVDNLRMRQRFLSRSQIHEFESMVIDVTGKAIYELWKKAHEVLKSSIANQSSEVTAKCFSFFRDNLKELVYQSPFAERTFTKPRGYAGDFEMMNLIYRQQDMGESLFGRCMERSFLMCPEPQAVRNRSDFLLEKLVTLIKVKEGPVKILSVASGPAFEIQKLISRLSEEELSRVELHLLDQDEGSLQHAQRAIHEVCASLTREFRPVLIKRSIKEVIGDGLKSDDYDLIYSAGLFDYFSDSVANIAGKVLLKSLNSDGRLIIGNFNISTPNKFTMSLVFDWNLMYRSQENLTKIFTYPKTKLTIESEIENINLFCILSPE